VLINSIVADRRLAITSNLPWAIDLLALGLSAGLDFTGSLRQLVDKSSNPDDPLVEELNLILQELSIGKTRKQALLQFAERNPGPLVKEFVGAVVQAEERGNPLGEVLRIQAETSRSRRSFRAEELAAKASVKLVIPMTLLLVAVLIMIVAPLALDISTTLGDS
jgi:tight adherence protein C